MSLTDTNGDVKVCIIYNPPSLSNTAETENNTAWIIGHIWLNLDRQNNEDMNLMYYMIGFFLSKKSHLHAQRLCHHISLPVSFYSRL
jgi:hypothetical protein